MRITVLALTVVIGFLKFQQFSDVPAGHWAAKAVGELREAGILKGYPDGRFRG